MKTNIKHIFAMLVVFLVTTSSYSQQSPFQQWFNTYNNPASTNDAPKKMAVDNSGNVYLTGKSDTTINISWSKTTTVKFNASGSLQWAKNFYGPLNRVSQGGGGAGVAPDNSGNVYVLSVVQTSQFNYMAYVIKYNSNGDTLWTKPVADTSQPNVYGDIKTDASGNIYATYVTANSTGHYEDIGVAKLNPSGQIIWQYSFNGPSSRSDIPTKLILDNSGNIYVTGMSQSLGWGGFYWYDIVTIKINNAGTFQWSSIYDDPINANDYPGDICLDASNNVYVTGTMTPATNNTNIIVLKIDGTNGSQQWARNPTGNTAFPGDYGYGVAVNPTGDVYVCGYMINSGTGPAVLLKFNNAGNEQWRRFYPVNSNNQFRAVKLDSNGNVIVTGDYFSGSVNYCMTAKYNSTGDILWNQSFNNGGTINSMFLEVLPGNACLIGGLTGSPTNSDMFALKYLQVTPQTITVCKSTNKPIRDLLNTFDTLNISGIPPTAQIIDVQFRIDTILHTYIHDLTGTLKGPSGLTDTIFKTPGKPQTGINIIGCSITDTASHLLDTSATAPLIGYYKPYKPLSSFSGNNPNGAWIFNVYDGAAGDTGSVRKYCITVNYFDPAALGIQTISSEIPHAYLLGQNYPNPFNPTTNIKFAVPKAGIVKMVVYDILGKVVTTLVNEYKQVGTYKVDFNGNNLASGVYFYKLEMADFTDIKKMVLIK